MAAAIEQDEYKLLFQNSERGCSLNLRTVVVVNDFGHVNGGAAQVAISSAKALAGRGIRVIYFSAVGPLDPSLRDAGVECVNTDQEDILSGNRLLAFARGIWNGHAAKVLGDLLSTLDKSSSVIHLHGWSKALSVSVFRAALDSGIQCVHTLHEYFSACPNGGFYDYQSNQICRKPPMGIQCISTHCDARSYSHKAWRVARQLIATRAAFSTGGIRNVISLSRLSRTVLEPHLEQDIRWYEVRNPVVCLATERTHAEDNTNIVFLGRLSPEKGVDVFLEAARKQPFNAVVVGDGPLLGDLSSRFSDARFLGWQDAQGVDQVLRSARALVFPSRWYETFGLTVLEALGYGVPVIVSDSTAAVDFVTPENGWVFPDGNVDALAERLRALTDSSLTKRMSESAYETYWSDPPDEASHCSNLIHVYEDMLVRSKAVQSALSS